ncbi:uncharacterized protein LOC130625071 [Hydractinia symbiolongicarpus]|uniref:uncharacterized protein LOC130625071 n=1 Tax=Hydractinia symbiolongicarpus TaxID=13093 RepID=UPI00254BE099|nr:uncharacterized protein LOC130625071 [Hydractinia symbiolongicarpus]
MATCTESRETRYRLCDDPLPRNNGSLCITKNNYSKIYEVESRSCTSKTCQQRLRGEGDKSSKKLSTLEFLLTLFGGCLIGIILLAIVMQIAKCSRNKKDSLVLHEVIQGVDNIALSDTNVSSNNPKNAKNITTSGVVVNNNSEPEKEKRQ